MRVARTRELRSVPHTSRTATSNPHSAHTCLPHHAAPRMAPARHGERTETPRPPAKTKAKSRDARPDAREHLGRNR